MNHTRPFISVNPTYIKYNLNGIPVDPLNHTKGKGGRCQMIDLHPAVCTLTVL